MLRFHDSFNLYNIGFTAGIVGTIFVSVLRSFGVNIESVDILYLYNNRYISTILYILFIYLMVIGLVVNRNTLRQYTKIFQYKGRVITDFTQLLGYGITFFNMGLMGILSLMFINIVGGIINGPVLAGIFTVVGLQPLASSQKLFSSSIRSSYCRLFNRI